MPLQLPHPSHSLSSQLPSWALASPRSMPPCNIGPSLVKTTYLMSHSLKLLGLRSQIGLCRMEAPPPLPIRPSGGAMARGRQAGRPKYTRAAAATKHTAHQGPPSGAPFINRGKYGWHNGSVEQAAGVPGQHGPLSRVAAAACRACRPPHQTATSERPARPPTPSLNRAYCTPASAARCLCVCACVRTFVFVSPREFHKISSRPFNHNLSLFLLVLLTMCVSLFRFSPCQCVCVVCSPHPSRFVALLCSASRALLTVPEARVRESEGDPGRDTDALDASCCPSKPRVELQLVQP